MNLDDKIKENILDEFHLWISDAYADYEKKRIDIEQLKKRNIMIYKVTSKNLRQAILEEIEKTGEDIKDLSKEHEYKEQSNDRCIWNTAIETVLVSIRKILS